MPTPAPIPGPAGAAGAAGSTGPTGPAGPAPSGTGLVSVTGGVLDAPSTLVARVAAESAAIASALGVSSTTTYYANSFVAVAGSESASIAGTGKTAAITLGATATMRAYGTSGVTAARALLTLPVGTRSVWVELQTTGFTGSGTSGNRYLAVAVQNVASGVPTALWGVASTDSTSNSYGGNFLAGVNAGGVWSTNSGVAGGADRWMRATLGLEGAQLTALYGTGSAGARPATWAPPGAVPGLNNGYAPIPDTSSQLYLVIFYLSAGGGGANTVTLRATVKATV